MFDGDDPAVRQAGWTYLIAMHLGTAFLLVMFLLLADGGSLDFDQLHCLPAANPVDLPAGRDRIRDQGRLHAAACLAARGPPGGAEPCLGRDVRRDDQDRHLRPVANAHASSAPPAWWGWILIGIGMISGILGVLFALAQHDLKRLLAYHSVENIGIIAIGLGLGCWG